MPGFSAIVGSGARVLVLGSMPGQASLTASEYYAHPANAFWWIMSQLLSFSLALDYRSRCEKLIEAQIAVWDVLHDCQRPGSLDSQIRSGSESPNNIGQLLDKHPGIQAMFFNGKKAEQLFAKFIRASLAPEQKLNYYSLPSTSAAYASMPRAEKFRRWQTAFLETGGE